MLVGLAALVDDLFWIWLDHSFSAKPLAFQGDDAVSPLIRSAPRLIDRPKAAISFRSAQASAHLPTFDVPVRTDCGRMRIAPWTVIPIIAHASAYCAAFIARQGPAPAGVVASLVFALTTDLKPIAQKAMSGYRTVRIFGDHPDPCDAQCQERGVPFRPSAAPLAGTYAG
ncbi:hypothetical protein [Paracoccus aminovorans]|nr:hypothetical protein [Paracoccus aminovorans]